MYKSCNVVVLSTNEKAKINLNKYRVDKPALNLDSEIENYKTNPYQLIIDRGYQPQHLYITSDDEIKEGDWYLHISFDITGEEYKTLNQCHKPHRKQDDDWFVDGMYSNQCHKIIATTNSSLNSNRAEDTKLFVEYIPQQFIENYVIEYNKGNIITEVMVEHEIYYTSCLLPSEKYKAYKPKLNQDNTIIIKPVKDSFSREEVVNLLNKLNHQLNIVSEVKYTNEITLEQWIEENL